MSDVPDFIARAIEAQGRTSVEDVEAAIAADAIAEPDEDALWAHETMEPEPEPEPEQEALPLPCGRCGGTREIDDPETGGRRRCPVCTIGEEELPPSEHVGPHPERTIREAFIRFHGENPHVYDELYRLTAEAHEAGARKIGIGMLFEVLRWKHTLRTGGDSFKLNNNYRSYYARLILARHPELGDIFELRKLHGPGLGDGEPAA